MKPKSKRRNALLAGLGVLLLVGLGLGGRACVLRQKVEARIPARPAVSRLSAPLQDRLTVAEQQARSFRSPVKGLQELARLYHANGFLAEARETYRGLLALEAENPRWPHLLASILAGYGQLDDALPLWRRTIELAPDYLPARLRLGEALVKANQPGKAVEVYNAVLQREAAHPYALVGIARVEIDAGNGSAAREKLQRAVRANPKFAAAWGLLATVDAQLGNQAEAEMDRANEQASGKSVDPPDPWLDELMSDCYDPYRLRVAAAAAPDGSVALPLLERAIQVAPSDAAVHRQLGDLLTKRGEYPKAREQLQRAVELDPKDAENWAYLLNALDLSGDGAAGDRALAAGLANCPESPSLHLERGRRLERAGQHEAALAAFERSRQLRPKDVDAYVEMSGVYFRLDRVNEGIAILRRALAVEPAHPVVLSALAFCAIGTGDEAAARTALREARAQPRVPRADLEQLEQQFRARFGHTPW